MSAHQQLALEARGLSIAEHEPSIEWTGEPRYKQWEVAILYASGSRKDFCFPKCSYNEQQIMRRAMHYAAFNHAPAFAIRGEGFGTFYAGPVLNALGQPKNEEAALRAIVKAAEGPEREEAGREWLPHDARVAGRVA